MIEFGETTLATDDQAAFKTISGSWLSLRKPKEAEAAFSAALAAKAEFADALLGLAALRAGSGDLEGARKIVDAVLAQPRAPLEASMLQAQLLLAKGESEAASAVLAKVLATKPDYLQARYQLTSMLIAKGDLEQASAQVGAIRKVSKQDGRAYYFEALIASRRNDLPAARAAIQQTLKGTPQNVPSLLLAARSSFARGSSISPYYSQALSGLLFAVCTSLLPHLYAWAARTRSRSAAQPLNRGIGIASHGGRRRGISGRR